MRGNLDTLCNTLNFWVEKLTMYFWIAKKL